MRSPSRNRRGIVRIFAVTVAATAVFATGYGFGNNTIRFGGGTQQELASQDLPADLDYTSVEEMYDVLKGNYDGTLGRESLLDGLKQGLAAATGDPYTEYLNEEEAEAFNDQLEGTFTGIGAELNKEEELLTVVAPITGFPAEKAGLRAGDVIATIDGESAFELTLTEAVNRIRGEKGTTVSLGIIRDSQEIKLDIVRDEINIPSVETEVTDENIGIITVSRFGDDTTVLMRKAAQEFKTNGIEGIVLDLRNNPGGLLSGAVDVSSLWLQNKPVLEERRGDKVIRTFRSQGTAPLAAIPTVVLINEGSASASEIVAGALHDHGVATLIGQKTYGKGSVQELKPLRAGGILKVTIARWFTPEGKNIDKEGIAPDQEVEYTEEDFKADRDPQLEAAKAQLAR